MHGVPCDVQPGTPMRIKGSGLSRKGEKEPREQTDLANQHLVPLANRSPQPPFHFLQLRFCVFHLRSVPGYYHNSAQMTLNAFTGKDSSLDTLLDFFPNSACIIVQTCLDKATVCIKTPSNVFTRGVQRRQSVVASM